jgi:hypothetical protein
MSATPLGIKGGYVCKIIRYRPIKIKTFLTLDVVIFTHQSTLGQRGGLWPFSLCVIHKEGLCPCSGDINRLMMMMISSF